MSSAAPAWQNAPNCHKCKKKFGLLSRPHHCRNCGRTFCDDDSKKTCPIPHFGFHDAVRVCDECFTSLTKPQAEAKASSPPPSQPSSVSSSYAPSARSKPSYCTCDMPICICQKPVEDQKTTTQRSTASASASASAPKPKPTTTYSQNYTSTFVGFGSTQNTTYDMSGDLNEQCREAIKNGHLAGVEKLIQAGASPSYTDRTGNTLLHIACMFNRGDIAQFLISKGAQLDVKNHSKETPLDLAPPSLAHKLGQ